MNLLDYILLGILALTVIFSVIYIIRRRKRGCSGCCGNCPYSGSCQKNDKTIF